MQKITPFLWFNTEAEEAADFYVSIFPNSKKVLVTHYGESGAGPKDKVMTVSFRLNGQDFTALNGGTAFHLTEAVSMVVNCETQEELDNYWEKLSAGGKKVECGWLKDKYGLSWQVWPSIMMNLLGDPNQQKVDRVMKAVMQMTKLDIKTLQRAAAGP